MSGKPCYLIKNGTIALNLNFCIFSMNVFFCIFILTCCNNLFIVGVDSIISIGEFYQGDTPPLLFLEFRAICHGKKSSLKSGIKFVLYDALLI